MFIKKSSVINAKAEFRSKALEDEYYKQQIDGAKKYIQYIILVAGIAFFAISLYDYNYNDDFNTFFRSTIMRGVVLLIAIASFFFISKTKKVVLICTAITSFPVVLVLGFIYILAQQYAQGLVSQAMAIMVVIFCTTLLPNRWINLVVTDIFIVVFFLLFSTTYITTASSNDYMEITIYLIITLLFSISVEYRSNIAAREKFLWEMELQEQAITDKLTGVYNRLWFDRVLTDWCAGKGDVSNFSLVLLDIDDFKTVNDTHGHLAGDQVLIDIARILKESVRATDMLARWGGEEFALLLPSAENKKAAQIANHIRRNVEQHEFDHVGYMTLSCGVAAYEDGDQMDSLIKKADDMLYAAKYSGKNCVKLYGESDA